MSERRLDPLTGEWRTFALPGDAAGASRGHPGPAPRQSYDMVVVEERFPPASAEAPLPTLPPTRLYPVAPDSAASELVCYGENLPAVGTEMTVAQLERVIAVWADRYAQLGARENVHYVFVFEDGGELASDDAHLAHGRIHAYPEIPPVPWRELQTAQAHLEANGTCVLCDVVARERADGVRIVDKNRSFLTYVPFAARFPYEVHVIARRHATSLLDLSDPERAALAALLYRLMKGLNRLFASPTPYVMSMHQSPTDDGQWLAVSHFHMEFTPARQHTGLHEAFGAPQLGAGVFINDVLPEDTAAELRTALAGAVQ